MKSVKKFKSQSSKFNQIFYDYMKEKGFEVSNYDNGVIGYGVIAYNDKDRFIPIFNLYNWLDPEVHSIYIEDRNGNPMVSGNVVAIYSLELDEKWNENEILNKFKMIIEEAYEKYKNYNKDNKLEFNVNKMELDYKHFNVDDKGIEI